MYPRR